MIPLRLKTDTQAGAAPFVVRVRRDTADDERDAVLIDDDAGRLEYRSAQGPVRLFGAAADDVEGDVLLVIPARGIAHRLIRARSEHNAFLVTEQCDQLCLMCSQPPKPGHVDLYPLLEQAARLAPMGATIGITGGEPTLHKRELFRFLRNALAERPDLRFHVLTNGQHFEPDDHNDMQAWESNRVLWGVPVYSPFAAEHDHMVGKDGAHARLSESLALLATWGAEIELRTVVLAPAAPSLRTLARWLITHTPFVSFWAIMQLENIGFGRKNWTELFADTSAHFDDVAAAVDTATAHGLPVSLYNFPLCTVPIGYRKFAVSSISDWKRRYLTTCHGCNLRDRCGGFFEWYPEGRGFSKVEAQ
jgi:His-Xaa-Ser system radical SAM maturase HxsC